MSIPAFIDYSQYRIWNKCPWAWYWRYVAGFQKKFIGQRKDALALGSLVHSGLQSWGERKIPKIDPKVIEEMTPTSDCLISAQELVEEYVQRYPEESWAIERFEQPLMFNLLSEYQGLAKVDAYFFNPTQCDVESGVPDYTISLSPGWWIREYKTKDASISRGNWNQNWEVNMQAAFQMLALQAQIHEPVQGVLISVLEKPRRYIPKRKCKACGEQLEMGLYLSTGDGLHACPLCGEKQKLSPYEPKTRVVPQYYRVVATRNEAQLQQALQEITRVRATMEGIAHNGKLCVAPTRENCVHPIYGSCEYYKLDTYGIQPEEDESLERRDPTAYTKESSQMPEDVI